MDNENSKPPRLRPWDACVVGPRDMTLLEAAPYLLTAARRALEYLEDLENRADPFFNNCEEEKRLLREAILRTVGDT